MLARIGVEIEEQPTIGVLGHERSAVSLHRRRIDLNRVLVRRGTHRLELLVGRGLDEGDPLATLCASPRRQQALSLHGVTLRDGADDLEHGRHHIDRSRDGLDPRPRELAAGQLHDQRDANHLFESGVAVLVVEVARVVLGELLTVVAREHDQRVLVEAPVLQRIE